MSHSKFPDIYSGNLKGIIGFVANSLTFRVEMGKKSNLSLFFSLL
jgi:hypothetical protein